MYQPILKGKKAEFDAWAKVGAARRRDITPLFEIVADKGVTQDLEKFRNLVIGACQANDVVAVDALALGDGVTVPGTQLDVFSWLKNQCGNAGITMQAVLHLDDSAQSVRDAVNACGSKNIVLRVGGPEGDPHPAATDMSLQAWCQAAGLQQADVHLLVDFASVYGLDPVAQQSVAQAYLAWAAANGPWASVTLASGAFPSQITALSKSTPNKVPRSDAALWNLVQPTSPVSNLRFGDYGIRYPELSDTGFGGPLPNLRYATGDAWIVWREAKLQQYPNGSFYAVCAGITGQPEYSGSGFSWADGVIDQKSRATPGPQPGAGTGTEWITYGMNRHMEFVIDRLTNGLGA